MSCSTASAATATTTKADDYSDTAVATTATIVADDSPTDTTAEVDVVVAVDNTTCDDGAAPATTTTKTATALTTTDAAAVAVAGTATVTAAPPAPPPLAVPTATAAGAAMATTPVVHPVWRCPVMMPPPGWNFNAAAAATNNNTTTAAAALAATDGSTAAAAATTTTAAATAATGASTTTNTVAATPAPPPPPPPPFPFAWPPMTMQQYQQYPFLYTRPMLPPALQPQQNRSTTTTTTRRSRPGTAVAAPGKSAGSCCCNRAAECNKLRNEFAKLGNSNNNNTNNNNNNANANTQDTAATTTTAATASISIADPHGRGLPPYRIGWRHHLGATDEWRRIFAATLNVSVEKLDQLSDSTSEGTIRVNRLHYDPSQIDLFKSNIKARVTPIPATTMSQYTDVIETRAAVPSKKNDSSLLVHHFPNYPWADVQRDFKSLTSGRGIRCQTFAQKRKADLEQNEQRKKLAKYAKLTPTQVLEMSEKLAATEAKLEAATRQNGELQQQGQELLQHARTAREQLRRKQRTLLAVRERIDVERVRAKQMQQQLEQQIKQEKMQTKMMKKQLNLEKEKLRQLKKQLPKSKKK